MCLCVSSQLPPPPSPLATPPFFVRPVRGEGNGTWGGGDGTTKLYRSITV